MTMPNCRRRAPLAGLLALIAMLAASVADVRAQARGKAPAPQATPEGVLKWINGYRAEPAPKRLPDAVKALSSMGAFKDPEQAGIYIGFMAGVIGTSGAKADDLVARIFPLAPEDHWAVVRAIAYSDHADWKGLLERFSERMPTRAVMIDRYLTGKLPTLKQVALDNGAAPIDTLWGYYYATGSYEPLLRIVSVLTWSKERNNVERLTAGSMAKYTLAVNASRDAELRRLLARAVATEPKATAAMLREVVEAAETMEVAAIRRSALASIEQLKVKGPQGTRDTAFWGQVGQTALALGCVTAAALGQEYVGIPCVIGGALSTAALKVWAAGQQQ